MRNKFPARLKVFGLAIYFQTSSLRGTARVLSEFRSISKTAVWRWVVKLRERLSMACEGKVRHFIAVDETRVKVNGAQCWVYSALDVDRNELICMRVYPMRNSLRSESFIKGVLRLCHGKPKFIVDNASWLRGALKQLELVHKHQAQGKGA